MNMNEITSIVLLKYDILRADPSTWHLCFTYPTEVQAKWAKRCAADVEHLAKGYPEVEKCIEVAKKVRDGMATEEELDTAISDIPITKAISAAYAAAHAAAHAATDGAARAANAAANTAVYAAHDVAGNSESRAEKWDLYISWLIEELCAWEQAQAHEVMVDQ